ncbi:hypothetical protein ACO2Q8_07865 [Larkinella sp. VNQ87]|uniref:hypothetical protein n=1 Tax=Larkinella sp. VNQ87 TaxID=3400921 RepID=UPI003C0D4EB0
MSQITVVKPEALTPILERITNAEEDIANLQQNPGSPGGVTFTQAEKDKLTALPTASGISQNITTAIDGVKGGVATPGDTLAKLYTLIQGLQAIVGGTAPDGDSVVNTVTEILAVMATYPEGVNVLTTLNGKVNTSDVLNALTETSAGKVLDARQGKVLKDALDSLSSTVSGLVAAGAPTVASQTEALAGTENSKYMSPLRFSQAYEQADEEFQFAQKATRNGVSIPLFKSLALASPSGLSVHASGGIVASADNVNGTGYISLGQAIDVTKPFRASVLCEIGNDTRTMRVQLTNDTNNTAVGVRMSYPANSGIGVDVGNSTTHNGVGGAETIPAGTKVWLNIVGDGERVTTCLILPSYSGLGGGGFQSALRKVMITQPSLITASASGVEVWGATQATSQLSRIYIQNASTQNKVLGVYIQQGNWDGPIDAGFSVPAVVQTKVLNEVSTGSITPWILIPSNYGRSAVDIIQYHHPNGNPGDMGNQPSSHSMIHALWEAGFVVCGLSGTQTFTDFAGVTASNWGAPAGLVYRKAMVDRVRALMPRTRKLNHFGVSMGGLNALDYEITYPGHSNKIFTVSGAVDLTASYGLSTTFANLIKAGYSDFWVNIQAATGITPGTVVNVTSNQAAGVTTLPVTALSAAIPAGTVLNFLSGTVSGVTSITVTAAAAAGATSITVSATTGTINSSAKFDTSAYWVQINRPKTAPPINFYGGSYTWRTGSYANATAYVVNDIVAISNTGAASNFADRDPVLAVSRLLNLKGIRMHHGSADATIPISQMTNFATAYQNAGGTVVTQTFTGEDHLTAACYGDPSTVVAFFQAP